MALDLLQAILPYVVFVGLNDAAEADSLIGKKHARDKEFFFQGWVKKYITKALNNIFPNIEVVEQGRNSFPDFLVRDATTGKPIQGYEVKGLAIPGRSDTFDANSKLPRGCNRLSDGTEYDVYYIFGRYRNTDKSLKVELADLVVFHGDLINADRWYQHKNLHVKGFGSYGDIMIRDRKMYVPKTPYALLSGIENKRTLIVPYRIRLEALLSRQELNGLPAPMFNSFKTLVVNLIKVGRIERVEVRNRITAYEVNLENLSIKPLVSLNPSRSRKHTFIVYSDRSLLQRLGSFTVTLK